MAAATGLTACGSELLPLQYTSCEPHISRRKANRASRVRSPETYTIHDKKLIVLLYWQRGLV